VARPIVESYIRKSIGPQAVLRDLVETVRILSRFGPRLPALVEGQLIKLGNQPRQPMKTTRRIHWLWLALLPLAAFCLGLIAAQLL
ncbi:MAG: hypothetical protein B7Z31_04290, partial [Rhodobacterales bacterium 12-65-15]